MQHHDVLLQASAIVENKPSLDLASARRLAMLEFREQMSARWDKASPPNTSERCLPPRQPSRRSSGVRSSSISSVVFHDDDHPSVLEREWSASHECPSSSSSLRMPRRSLDDATAEQQPPKPPARMPAAA